MLGALWLSGCGAPDASQDWPAPSPALWEATAPEGQRAFLFGTIHALPDGVNWRSSALEEAIAQSDMLMVEIADLDAPNDSADAFERYASGRNLAALLERVPANTRAEVAELLDAADRTEADFHHIDSWAAALILGNAVRCSDLSNGVDRALLREFEAVSALESFAAQFAIFDTLPADAQADLLVTVAKERDCRAGEARMRDWVTGNTDNMLASVEDGFRGNANLRNALLVHRNERFAQRLARYQRQYADETILLAIGAAHLPGPGGVAALLEREGYTVRRIQ
ncbi:MAG: TraB/GumN family protein [Alteraurantiacibacter sp.]